MFGIIELLILLGITGAGLKYMTSSSREDDDYDYYRPSGYSSYHSDRDEDINEMLERIRNSYVTTSPIHIPEIPRTNASEFDVDSITRPFYNTYFPETTPSTSPVLTGSSPRLYTFSLRTGRLEVDD